MTALVTIVPAAAAQTTLANALSPTSECSARTMPGGDWPMYGNDLPNTRTQNAETSLPPPRAARLAPRSLYDTGHPSDVLGLVDFNSTPGRSPEDAFTAATR